jgi:hypothetical protein
LLANFLNRRHKIKEKTEKIKKPKLKDLVPIKDEKEFITRAAKKAPRLQATNIILVANLAEDLSTSFDALENI